MRGIIYLISLIGGPLLFIMIVINHFGNRSLPWWAGTLCFFMILMMFIGPKDIESEE